MPSTSEIQQLLHSGDSFAAIEHIQERGTHAGIAALYQSLIKDLYWKARDLPAVITIGRAGIIYCITQSLRSEAKAIAYNVGSFTWPGWEEPGINPSPEDLAVGRDCALLNLRLAIELQKPADKISMAHWLVGAHALAAGDAEGAEKQFLLSMDILPESEEWMRDMKACSVGYLSVARLRKNPSDPVSIATFEEIIARFKSRSDGDAKTYLAQLLVSQKLFVTSNKPSHRP